MNEELDTEFWLPGCFAAWRGDIKKIQSSKCCDLNGDKFLAINYHNITADLGMIPCDYEYHLDYDDKDYLFSLIANKLGIKDIKDALRLCVFLDRGTLDYSNDFDILYEVWDELIDYNKDILDRLLEHCKDKAIKEFKVAFDYWIEDEDKAKYYIKKEQ